MKTMKKVLAMLVSMVMVLAFCVTGVAADVELTQHSLPHIRFLREILQKETNCQT